MVHFRCIDGKLLQAKSNDLLSVHHKSQSTNSDLNFKLYESDKSVISFD